MKNFQVVLGLIILGSAGAILVSCSHVSSLAVAPQPTKLASFSAHGSYYEAYVLGAKPGETLVLVNKKDQEIQTGVADNLGSLIFRNLRAESDYRVISTVNGKIVGTKTFDVISPSNIPPESFYSSQHLHAGLNYITMRDGVKLAATVRLPFGKTSLSQGPFPTVIEYSGYAIAAPGNPLEAILNPNHKQSLPLPDSATDVGSVVAPLFGFATVSLQMRGTGCSGGAFDLFGLATTYDGYDAVRIVASQPWVKNHRVALIGISFSGISQLFVGGANPPGLAAIAPLSVTNDLYDTGFPGGIYNNGFAKQWVEQRIQDSKPAPGAGQAWATDMIDRGDSTCLANQALHDQVQNVNVLMGEVSHRIPSLYDPRSPELWASKVKVPVYIAGAFHDDETGGQWSNILPYFNENTLVFATIINGTHVDSVSPQVVPRWLEFLYYFVANEIPPPSVQGLYPIVAKEIASSFANTSAPIAPPLRFTNSASASQAREEFIKNTPRVRVLFDNGNNPGSYGSMYAPYEMDFNSWPPKRAEIKTFYLGLNGDLETIAPSRTSYVSFKPNPALRPAVDLPSGASPWVSLPPYSWTPIPEGAGLGFISSKLTQNVALTGPGSLNLYLKSSAPDTDIQVTVSAVFPNGKEMYIQNGWLRASDRYVNEAKSTPLHPKLSYLKSNAVALPAGKFTLLRIPILPMGYIFRAGDRIRVTISAPGGDRPEWAFDTFKTNNKVTDTVEVGPSSIVLPVIQNVDPSDPEPPCPSLRGEPCRTYIPLQNGG